MALLLPLPVVMNHKMSEIPTESNPTMCAVFLLISATPIPSGFSISCSLSPGFQFLLLRINA